METETTKGETLPFFFLIWLSSLILSGLILGSGIVPLIAPIVITLVLALVLAFTDVLSPDAVIRNAIRGTILTFAIYIAIFASVHVPHLVHKATVFVWYTIGIPLVSLMDFVGSVPYILGAIVLSPAVILTVGILFTVLRTGRSVEWSLILRMIASMLMLGVLTVVFITALWRIIEFFVWYSMSLFGIDPGTRMLIARVVTGGLLVTFVYRQFGRTTAVERHRDATSVTSNEFPTLHALTTKVASQLDVPTPTIAVAEHAEPEAITVGYRPGNITLILSQGTLDTLDDEELEAVIAHELAHVANMDAMVTTIAAIPLLLADGLYPSADSSEEDEESEDKTDTYQIDTDSEETEHGPFAQVLRQVLRGNTLVPKLIAWLVLGVILLPVIVVYQIFGKIIPKALFEGSIALYLIIQVPLLVIALITEYIVGPPIVAVLSRTRESAADRTAATVTGSPAALARALRTLEEQIAETPSEDLREASNLSSLSILPLDSSESTPEENSGTEDDESVVSEIVALLIGVPIVLLLQNEEYSEGIIDSIENRLQPIGAAGSRIKNTLYATHPPTDRRIDALTALSEEYQEES
jgi:heat shock protein HtpX